MSSSSYDHVNVVGTPQEKLQFAQRLLRDVKADVDSDRKQLRRLKAAQSILQTVLLNEPDFGVLRSKLEAAGFCLTCFQSVKYCTCLFDEEVEGKST
jgi:hypothetical protein